MGGKRFLLVTYFPTNLVNPFTLRVTGIKIIKEERYSRVPRLPDTRYSAKGTKGERDMQAAKRD